MKERVESCRMKNKEEALRSVQNFTHVNQRQKKRDPREKKVIQTETRLLHSLMLFERGEIH